MERGWEGQRVRAFYAMFIMDYKHKLNIKIISEILEQLFEFEDPNLFFIVLCSHLFTETRTQKALNLYFHSHDSLMIT